MSDQTKTYHDYEFHFAEGPPLYLTVEVGRDVVADDDEGFSFILYHDNTEVLMRVQKRRLNAWQRTQRVDTQADTATPVDFESAAV